MEYMLTSEPFIPGDSGLPVRPPIGDGWRVLSFSLVPGDDGYAVVMWEREKPSRPPEAHLK